jgi:hypothetical protein
LSSDNCESACKFLMPYIVHEIISKTQNFQMKL